jgi:DNA-binding transcriptional regulator LsrR (DeoR family)
MAYYEHDLTQDQIAERFGVSRSQVSRYLRESHELDIVQIRIVAPDTRQTETEAALVARFPHLREVVVPTVFSLDPVVTRRVVARAAARLVERLVQPGATLCFGAGRTLGETVGALRKRPLRNVTVCQAMGNAGHLTLAVDSDAVASRAAAAFDGVAWQINAPAILGAGASASDLESSNPTIREALERARRADLFVLGIGSMSGDEIFVRTGLVTNDELAALAEAGAVGDICANFFDLVGRPVPGPFRDRVVGIRLDDLPGSRLSLAVACGEAKVAAILGALHGRHVNALVTDEHTAARLLDGAGAAGPGFVADGRSVRGRAEQAAEQQVGGES